MNEKENKNRRDLYLKIRVSREELDAIDRKFRNSGGKVYPEDISALREEVDRFSVSVD